MFKRTINFIWREAADSGLRQRNWNSDRRGVATVEFAVSLLALVLFTFTIVNFGDMAFCQYSLNNGVESAARSAAIQASNTIAASGPISTSTEITAADCPRTSAIQNSFNQAAAPAYNISNPPPAIGVAWWGSMTNCGGAAANPPPGGGVLVTASAPWTPIAAAGLFPLLSVTLSASQSIPVTDAPPS